MGLEALGAIAGGISRGMDMNQRDRMYEDDMATRKENQEWIRSQRDLQSQAQKREDVLRDELNAIPATGTEMSAPSDLGPGVKLQTDVGVAKAQGQAYQRAGKYDQARERFNWANEAASKAAAEKALGVLRTMPKESSMYDLARAIAPGINEDDSPIGIKNIVKNPDGSVGVNLYNKSTGFSSAHTFNDVNSLRDALTYHYAPEYARKMDEMRASALLKQEKVGPGEVLVQGGQPIYTNPNEHQTVTAARIRAEQKAGGGVGTVTGKGGAKEDSPLKPYDDAFKFQATDGDTKLTPEQLRIGSSFLPSLAKQNVDPRIAARIAGEVAIDPTKSRLEVNLKTGQVDRIYRNPDINQGESIILSTGAGNLKDLEKQNGGPEKMREVAGNVVMSIAGQAPEEQRPALQKQLINIASNPELRKQYLSAAADAGKDVSVIGRQLDLIGSYLKPDAPAAPKENKIPSVGGMDFDRYKGLNRRQQDEAIAQDARNFREANMKKVDTAAAAADPDIVRLERLRTQALQAGNAVKANAIIEEIKKIKANKYTH